MEKFSEFDRMELDQIYDKIKSNFFQTPLIYAEFLSKRYERDIYLKLENFQKTGAFKIRGNSYKLAELPSGRLKKGVVTASSGNHGLGLSLAARSKDVPARIFVPHKTPQTKIDKIRSLGAEIRIAGDNYDEAVKIAKNFAAENERVYISSFDDQDIIRGNTTLGYEIFTQLPEPGAVVAPIGGGGGISGISLARNVFSSSTLIYGVEAGGAASMRNSLQKTRIESLAEVDTLADGIKVARPGDLTFEIVRENVEKVFAVSEDEMKESFRELLLEANLTAELAGAVSVAALDKLTLSGGEGPVVCLISGGNIDRELIVDILSELDSSQKHQ
ncbi:threonine ammonia-lyase [Halarsenatibacter silvermanii]|uniref:threonine ammonia-lyase n=1 Tax=Halarsenatibacter silvermanii TaxID=321763 RepID=UPI000B7D370B|nr:threonine/serine dehydratase [Halarsenatibacter silvermanii]